VPPLPLDKLTLEQLQLFLVLVVPGLVSIKFYDVLLPQRRNLANVLIEAILFSLVNLGIFWWAIVPLNAKEFVETHIGWYILGMIVFSGITPMLLAWATYALRTSELAYSKLGLDHPHRTGWEHFITRRQPCYIIFHLKGSEKDRFAGYYGRNSYAASFPEDPEVYVERLHEVDEHGKLVGAIADSLGSVIRLADVERVEFLKDPDYDYTPRLPWWKRLWTWFLSWLFFWRKAAKVQPPPTP
jgi:hypothetical protein